MSDKTAHSSMRGFYDDYVRVDFPNRRAADGTAWIWPGDEWVSAEVRESTYESLLKPKPGETWEHAVEIGPGSGKYTEMLLLRESARVLAYEFSPAFLESLQTRCSEFIRSQRLSARQIDWGRNSDLVADAADVAGRVDLFFGIDVFLMMDFQSTFAYLLSAARLLRPGGRFAGTFGDADSESGWARLLRDNARHCAFNDRPDSRFHWISRGMLERTLVRLGFQTIMIMSGPDGSRVGELDVARLYVVAELADPSRAAQIWRSLFGAGSA